MINAARLARFFPKRAKPHCWKNLFSAFAAGLL
jgi:hypothetical protein